MQIYKNIINNKKIINNTRICYLIVASLLVVVGMEKNDCVRFRRGGGLFSNSNVEHLLGNEDLSG